MILLLMTLIAAPASAQSRSKKLARGTVNFLTGWVEIPKNIYDKTIEEDALSGLTLGLSGGIGMFLIRTGTGLYEIVTFPIPVPENYQAILEPEFVFNNEDKRVTRRSNDGKRSNKPTESSTRKSSRVESFEVGGISVEGD